MFDCLLQKILHQAALSEYSVCSLLSAHNSPGAGFWRPVNIADVVKGTALISFFSFNIYFQIKGI